MLQPRAEIRDRVTNRSTRPSRPRWTRGVRWQCLVHQFSSSRCSLLPCSTSSQRALSPLAPSSLFLLVLFLIISLPFFFFMLILRRSSSVDFRTLLLNTSSTSSSQPLGIGITCPKFNSSLTRQDDTECNTTGQHLAGQPFDILRVIF